MRYTMESLEGHLNLAGMNEQQREHAESRFAAWTMVIDCPLDSIAYTINIGLTDTQIKDILNENFSHEQICALADLVKAGISSNELSLHKQRIHAANMRYECYMPNSLSKDQEAKIAERRTHRNTIKHLGLVDLTEMHNKRGRCPHYRIIDGKPVSLLKKSERYEGKYECEICRSAMITSTFSSSVYNRLNKAIEEFDGDCSTLPPVKCFHYNRYKK